MNQENQQEETNNQQDKSLNYKKDQQEKLLKLKNVEFKKQNYQLSELDVKHYQMKKPQDLN